MPYEFGDLILVRFPFTNQTALKQRPAVVVSSQTYNDSRPDVVIMAITSQIRSPFSWGQVLIGQWQAANLLKPSVIKPVFATLEQNLILRSLGTLQASDQAALRQAIAMVFA
ncbi:MAG TPA: type II toxin-antitoxin system PemK/MazF family toxin [Bryobacteraceae bacterium]|jgi:mRNA interferase MazF|nr:type II toxin-antitoxin system PemK/MazF family toxin [Bryobacteraceae bacterium]